MDKEILNNSPKTAANHELINGKYNYDEVLNDSVMCFIKRNKPLAFLEISDIMVSVNETHSNCLVAADYRLIIYGTVQSINGYKMEVSETEYAPSPFYAESILLPNTIPTSIILNEVNWGLVHRNIDFFEKQTLALDPFYSMHYSKAPFAPQLLDFSLTNYVPHKPVMAVITTYGACALLVFNDQIRKWKECKLIVNDCLDELSNIKKANEINSFKQLQRMIESYVITSGCWQNDSIQKLPLFYCSNAIGNIMAVRIRAWKAKLLFQIGSGLKNISRMVVRKNVLIVCNNEGILQSYQILNEKKFEKRSNLWEKEDNITCGKMLLNYCKESSLFYAVVCKAAHLLIFILNSDGKLLCRHTMYIGNIEITGLDCITTSIYVVATLCGNIEIFSFSYQHNKLDLTRSTIKAPFDIKNFHIKGMAASPNKVAWNFLIVPNKFHTGPTRNCHAITFLKTCSFNAIRPISLLLKYPNNFGNLIDCLETVRLDVLKNSSPEIYQNFKTEPIDFSLSFINRLRLEKSIHVFSSGVLKHSRNEIFITNMTTTIETIILYRRLKHLLTLENRTKFINTSGALMLFNLKNIYSRPYEEDPKTKIYREIFLPLVAKLIKECEGKFPETVNETCQVCAATISGITLKCPNDHTNPRCCISYLTMPLFSESICPNCKLSVVLDNFNDLRSVLPPDEEINCNNCNATIVRKPTH